MVINLLQPEDFQLTRRLPTYADADIMAIHAPITDIFKSCFLLNCQKYNVFYALTFFSETYNSGFMS